MQLLSGKAQGSVLVLHGGAASVDPDPRKSGGATAALKELGLRVFSLLNNTSEAEVVCQALEGMESDPQFNAGFGAALQSDGQVRVSSAIMTGDQQCFSGVINALGVRHPSRLALSLQRAKSRVVTEPGTQFLARSLGFPFENLVTEHRLKQWSERRKEGATSTPGSDTVGCVLVTRQKKLAAGTSTGGRGFEFPGRITDSATVAGNYASAVAAISVTGIGEEIVDDAVAARIETRCRDGVDLVAACEKSFAEAKARERRYGWIAVHQNLTWVIAHTTPAMSFVVIDTTGVISASAG